MKPGWDVGQTDSLRTQPPSSARRHSPGAIPRVSADPEDWPDAPSDPGAYRNTCLLRFSPRRCPGAGTLTNGLHLSTPHSTWPSLLRKPTGGCTAHLLQGPRRGWFPPPHQQQCSLEVGTLRCRGTPPSLLENHPFTVSRLPSCPPQLQRPCAGTGLRCRTPTTGLAWSGGMSSSLQQQASQPPGGDAAREPTPSWPTCS